MLQQLAARSQQLWPAIGLLAFSVIIWLLSGWIYWGEPAAPLSLAARFNFLLLAALCVVIYLVARIYWRKHATQQLIDPAAAAPTDEIRQLKEKFTDAIDVLKNAKFDSRLGSRNLYELPWYLMLGNPGSGKTSAILNSGLNFPLADRFGRNALSGLGGTRQCDWWFTNEAVFIDTAGRYTSQDSDNAQDRSAWQGFLCLLLRYRKRRPINGVIVTVSMQEILTATPDQRAQHARILRARLDELTDQFKLPFPVYVMLTKLDLLAGFNEYFADLQGDDADQVWGFTLQRNAESDAPVSLETVDKEIRSLLTRLNERLLARLESERDPVKRSFIIGFPQQYEIMEPILADFLSLTFSASRYTRQPQLRGLYFCSAKQEGAPIDRLAAAVAPQFGLRSTASSALNGKSYFLRQFFQSVLMPESELVGTNSKQENQLLWSRRSAYIGMGAVSVVLMAVWTGALIKHKQFVHSMQQGLAQIQLAEQKLTADSPLAGTAELMIQLKQLVQQSEQEQRSFFGRLGMRDTDIADAAQAIYRQQLANVYYPTLAHTVRAQFSNANQDALYEHLRVYLMLASPAHRDRNNINNWLNHYYSQDAAHASMTQSLLNDVFEQNGTASLTRPDEVAIKQARAVLLAQPLAQRIYQQIRSEYASDLVDIRSEANLDLSQTFKTNVRTNPYLISRMFTKAGYQQISISDAIERVKRDRWMWGEMPAFTDENLAKTEEQVKLLYLADYSEHWRMLLDSLDLPRPGSLSESVALLRKLTAVDQSALLSLLKVVSINTSLSESNKLLESAVKQAGVFGEASKTLAISKPTLVDLHFRNLNLASTDSPQRAAPVGQLLQTMREAQDFLANIATAPDAGEAALKAMRARTQGGQDPLQKLALAIKEQPQPLQRWLSALAQTSNAQLAGASGAQINQLWKDQVVTVWEQKLAGRYPFARGARNEISLRDFQEFFKPSGVLDKFVQEHLAGLVDPRRNFLSRTAESFGISASAAESLRQAYRIQAAFFAADPNQMKVEFRIKPLTMDDRLAQFSLSVGDQRLEYSHGPKIARDFVWPATNSETIRLSFEDLNQTPFHKSMEGEWAWLHALDASNKPSANANSMTLQFKEQNKTADFELSLKQSVNAFDPALLAGFDCPRSL